MPDQESSPPWDVPKLPTDQVLAILQNVFAERSSGLGDHSNVVAQLCEGIAPMIGLPDDQREPLAQAAFLHDVGKLSLPDSILGKPAPLSEDEWRRMRRHTILGERILMAIGLKGWVLKFVRSNHERIDGTGYPDGLAGEEIPLGARIIAVCDAYAAMTSSRPYRVEPMSSSAALQELRSASGTQFDSRVVDAVTSYYAPRPGGADRHSAAPGLATASRPPKQLLLGVSLGAAWDEKR